MRKLSVIAAVLALTMALSAIGFAANPNPKGQIVMVGQDVETLNPLLSESTYETSVLNGIFSQLVRIDETGTLLPDLAEEVPTVENGGISEDGLVYTFKLRKNAKWHDGEPVTAHDVAFTWNLIMSDDVQVVSRDGFDKVEKVEVVDDYTVSFYLKEALAAWMLNWAQTRGTIVPEHILGDVPAAEFTKAHPYSRAPIGSGPFKFVEWVTGSHVILEANKDYHREGPYLQRFIYRAVNDTNTQLTMLKTGEADIAHNLTGDQLAELQSIDRLNVTLDPASVYMHMTFNLDNPRFQDKRVRQALSYALPREAIVSKVLRGVGQAAATSTAPVSWAYDDSIAPHPFDLNKAKDLLDEAGWVDTDGDGIREKDGMELSFELATSAGVKIRERIAQIAQQYWKQIGVDLKIKLSESTTLFGDILENMKFDLIMFGWVTGSDPDEFTLYHSSQVPTEENGYVGQNYAKYSNPRIDELLDRGQRVADREERIKIYHEVQRIVYDELPMIYVYYYVNVNVAPKNLENWRPAPFTNGLNWNINELKLVD